MWVALGVSAAGLVVALLLVRVHAQAHAGITSFCTISDVVNCDRVAVSAYSVFLGIPVALWGVAGYALAAALSVTALRAAAARSAAWAGLLLVEAAAAVAVSIVLAVISEAGIGALCLLCAASWVISAALLVCAWRACRPRGVGAAVRDGLGMLSAHTGWTAAALAAAVAVIVVAGYAYPRYWERPPSARGAPSAPPAGGAGTARVVIEYSDYECPYCAKAHEETRQLREKRPDITVIRRMFPLDMACNPVVKQPMHQGACVAARAGICAQEQGRFHDMDDALFRNQTQRVPLVELARRAGLDVGRFQACLASPDTQRRLDADIAAGIQDRIRATPSYLVGGVLRSGDFPWELLPPPPAAGGQAQSQRNSQ